MEVNFVMVIAGSPGSGKTTLAKIASAFYKCAYISGDEVSKKLFPDKYENIEENSEGLKMVKERLLEDVKKIFDRGESVVVDYVILDKEYIDEYKELFGKNLIFRIIHPSLESIIERDRKRECWTSGEDTVKRIYEEYEKFKFIVRASNYIDNTAQTPEETFEKYFKIP